MMPAEERSGEMPFTSNILRTDAAALIPEEVTQEIFQRLPQASFAMQAMRRLPDVSRNQLRMPVLNGLIDAYFVDGDTGLKQTSTPSWINKYIEIGELAVFVPIPINVLRDSAYDIWGACAPQIAEAFGKKFDQAVLYGGGDTPTNWPTAIVPACTASGQNVALTSFSGNLFDAILGVGGIMNLIEVDGFMTTGFMAELGMLARLRGVKDTVGQPIFLEGMMPMQSTPNYTLAGNPIFFPRNGSVDSAQSAIICADWNEMVWAMRQDMEFALITQGVITDSANQIVHNLPQKDMVALRVTMRLGWQVPNPVSRINPSSATRYPAAVLRYT